MSTTIKCVMPPMQTIGIKTFYELEEDAKRTCAIKYPHKYHIRKALGNFKFTSCL